MESEEAFEFEAPVYSTIDIRAVGLHIVRTVVMEGEMQEFSVSRYTYFSGRNLEDGEI